MYVHHDGVLNCVMAISMEREKQANFGESFFPAVSWFHFYFYYVKIKLKLNSNKSTLDSGVDPASSSLF
jgi:hypothetical protein